MEGDVVNGLGNRERSNQKGKGIGARDGHEYGGDMVKGGKVVTLPPC